MARNRLKQGKAPGPSASAMSLVHKSRLDKDAKLTHKHSLFEAQLLIQTPQAGLDIFRPNAPTDWSPHFSGYKNKRRLSKRMNEKSIWYPLFRGEMEI